MKKSFAMIGIRIIEWLLKPSTAKAVHLGLTGKGLSTGRLVAGGEFSVYGYKLIS
jgi:hypothetical protein